MSETLLEPGAFFAGQKFEIVKLLGKGGMSEVYEAKRTSHGGSVALKILAAQYALREDYLARLKAESVFYSVLSHGNIVRMLDADQEELTRRVYIVMELLRGRTLRQLLVKHGHLKWIYALYLLNQLADAMTFAHAKGILHRDLKPENVMVSTDPANKGHLSVLDFGIAKYADNRVDTGALPPMGTARYMAPEQVRALWTEHRNIKIDGRADIYSFGALGYETIGGRHLFVDDACPPAVEVILNGHLTAEIAPLQDLAPDCPDALAAILHKCLERDRDKRYPTFRDLWDDLNSFRVSMPAEHPLAKTMAESKRLAARRRAFESSGPLLDEAEQEPAVHRPTGEMPADFMPPSSPLPFTPSGPIRVPVLRDPGKGYTEPLPVMSGRPPPSPPSHEQPELTLASARGPLPPPSSSSPWSVPVPVAALAVELAVEVEVCEAAPAPATASPTSAARPAPSSGGWHVVVERREEPRVQIMPQPPAPGPASAPRSAQPRPMQPPPPASATAPRPVQPRSMRQPPPPSAPPRPSPAHALAAPPRPPSRNPLPLYVVGPVAGFGIAAAITGIVAIVFFLRAPARQAEAHPSETAVATAAASSAPSAVATSAPSPPASASDDPSAQPPPEAASARVAVAGPAAPAKRTTQGRAPAPKPAAAPRTSATTRGVIPLVDDEPNRSFK